LPPVEGKYALHDDDAALALHALGWILSDEPRAERLLAMTGLGPDALRGSLDEQLTLAAILSFLAAHEPDLIACAETLAVRPDRLVAAARRLEGDESEAEWIGA
jgi:hypothetical protein